ncbi:unnamed protein product (mitochondrion) [Plasmodiophora brassicae]|uniref:SprT-like domain-containing protein n=1 Tax=Plasmodiophora brassicae TaxID=37360 RepID=A0A0G4IH75_PLABS|nr:hypothetical protein PBRA_000242 [Plasmodiophora brassicae]SPQ96803.1 unnamed protein product [Plasmodiophora brassicae]
MSDRPSSIIDLTADSDDGQGQVDADETLARRLQKAEDDAVARRERTDMDETLAIQLQWEDTVDEAVLVEETAPLAGAVGTADGDIDPELHDPTPDIYDLFHAFNLQFFDGALSGVELKWSARMTLCAGLCCYEGRRGLLGGFCSIRLSEKLLKFRPRSDLVNTLLHEMIHAFLFIRDRDRDHDAHGPNFCALMKHINQVAGTEITVYHNFRDEVDLYRTHWWKCDGPCQHRAPYFGIVKRSMNRAPSMRDPWMPLHQQQCGGTFTKIKEPEGYVAGKKRPAPRQPSASSSGSGKQPKIDDFFRRSPDKS